MNKLLKNLAASKSGAAWLSGGLPLLVAALLYSRTAAAGLTYNLGGEDGGELATAAFLGGVPHPTGYPLYMLMARLFLLLPLEPARAMNLASAFWGAIGAGLVGLATYRLYGLTNPAKSGSGWAGALGGCLAGLSLAVAPLVWSQAVITEVYAFNLALTGLVLLTFSFYWSGQRGILLLGICSGLLVGHHRTGIFTLAGLVVALLMLKVKPTRRDWLKLAGGLIAGAALPYLYLLAVAGQQPAANWSDPTLANLGGWWSEVSGGDYRNLLFAAPVGQSLGRVSAAISLLLQNFGLSGLLLGWLGLVLSWRETAARPLAALVSLSGILHLLFAAVYAADNSQVYLIPLLLFWAVMAGWAVAWLGDWLGQKRLGWAVAGLIAAALSGPATSLITNYSQLDLSHDQQAAEWAAGQLENVPPQAILVTYRDAATFSLEYGQQVQKRRPDVALVELRLLNTEWYRRNLARLYPELILPAPSAATTDLNQQIGQLQAANPSRSVRVVADPKANQ